jgi:hypothetical protein
MDDDDDAKWDVDRYISGPARPERRLVLSKTHQLMTLAALDHRWTCSHVSVTKRRPTAGGYSPCQIGEGSKM